MASWATKSTGSTLTATEWNLAADEIENAETAGSETPSAGSTDQLGKAMTNIASNVTYYTDSGAVNAYVLSVISPNKAPTSYRNGMVARFRTSNANTGASTANLATLGVKNIKLEDGSTDPSAGDISDSLENWIIYDGTNFRLIKGGRNEFDNIQINNKLNIQRAATAISSGAINFTNSFLSITGEGGTTDTLTDINNGVLGDKLTIYRGTAYNITITHNSSKINLSTTIDVTMKNGDILDLVCIGSNTWLEVSRALANDFLYDRVTNGYQYLPSGLILQWGKTTNPSGDITPGIKTESVTFPLTYPNAVLGIFPMLVVADNTSNYDVWRVLYNPSTSGVDILYSEDTAVAQNLNGFYWMSIGY